MSKSTYVRFFEEFGIEDVPLVGGKNASLGEMFQKLSSQGVRIPHGFAITAQAYRHMLDEAGAWDRLQPSSTSSTPPTSPRWREKPSALVKSSTAPGCPTIWPPKF